MSAKQIAEIIMRTLARMRKQCSDEEWAAVGEAFRRLKEHERLVQDVLPGCFRTIPAADCARRTQSCWSCMRTLTRPDFLRSRREKFEQAPDEIGSWVGGRGVCSSVIPTLGSQCLEPSDPGRSG